MFVVLNVLDSTGAKRMTGRYAVNPVALIVVAESRQDIARAKGRDWASGLITYMARELLDIHMRAPGLDAERAAMNLAMAVWVMDSVFVGTTDEQFAASDIILSVWPDGTVAYDRVQACSHP